MKTGPGLIDKHISGTGHVDYILSNIVDSRCKQKISQGMLIQISIPYFFRMLHLRQDSILHIDKDLKMIKNVAHIGLTVSDLGRSIAFYRDILGLYYKGQMRMDGKETDNLFARKNATARVAYLTFDPNPSGSDVELIQFENFAPEFDEASLFKTSISELCFEVKDIDEFYTHLLAHGVETLSEPQYFDSESTVLVNQRLFILKIQMALF